MMMKSLTLQVCMLLIASTFVLTSTDLVAGHEVTFMNPPATFEVLADAKGAEVSIAVNPTNAKNVVIAHNYYQSPAGTPLKYSNDGGYTWDTTKIGQGIWGDPFLAFDASGNLYYVSFFGIGKRVQVSKSIDGGASFAAQNVIAQGGSPVKFQTGGSSRAVITDAVFPWVDFPKITCDQSNSQYRNNVYVVFNGYVCTDGDDYPEYPGAVFMRSTDGGATWGSITPISARSSKDVPRGDMPMNIGVGLDGKVYVAMESTSSSPYIVKSTDGGQTFTAPAAIFPNPGTYGLTSFERFPVIQPSLTQVNVVYLAFSAMTQGSSDYDIFVSKSTDYGATWQAPVRVNDDAVNNAARQHRPFMSVSAYDRIDVTWWDYRFSTAAEYADMYYSYSADGGATFSPNSRLTPTTLKFDSHDPYSNDYSTVASLGGEALAAYAYPASAAPEGPMSAYVSHVYLSPILNVNSGDYFATIQEAINAASPGDVIEVSPGTYGLINVDRPLTILSTHGPDRTTIDGGGFGAVSISANDVCVYGFTITNGYPGVYFGGCSGGYLIGNYITGNSYAGVRISQSSYLEIHHNLISTADGSGVLLDSLGTMPTYNTISDNRISDCYVGLNVLGGHYNIITRNSVVNNQDGIDIYAHAGANIIFHNSFVTNTASQARDGSVGGCSWDDGVSTGNYWSDYIGQDANADGIGDTPYLVPNGRQDNYPYMAIVGPRITVLAEDENGQALSGIPVLIDQASVGNTGGTFTVLHGSHYIAVSAEQVLGGNEYAFLKWSDGVAGASRLGQFYSDATLKALYAKEKVLNTNTGQRYLTIGEAVSSAAAGHTILVGAGTYHEIVGVQNNRPGLTLRGEGASTTVIDSRLLAGGTAVWIGATNVLLEGFTLISDGTGLQVLESGITARSNIVTDCDVGIWTVGGNACILTDNQVARCGIGITVGFITKTTTTGTISRNTLENNGIGIELAYSDSVVITENKIRDNGIGILLGRNDDIAGSAVANAIYHNNFVGNTVQAQIQSTATVTNNVWDNGPTSGGNYWSNYAGTDGNGDGFGDSAYVINTNNKDYYPLMTPWGEAPPSTHKLTVLAGYYDSRGAWKPLTGTVWIDTVTVGNTGQTFTVADGTHTVQVKDPIVSKGKTYHFQYWVGGIPATNPGPVTVNADMTITALYAL